MVAITVSDNILLRSYKAEDAQELFDVINSSRRHLHPWLTWVDKTTKPEHSLQFIQHSIHQQEVQEALVLGIFYDDKIIGGVGMHHWDLTTKRAQIGYWISESHEGKGIISDSLKKFTSFLFDKLDLNKIEVHFVPTNKRSAAVATRLGCKVEGVIRQSLMRNGMPEDVVVMGLLKSEKQIPG
ncbi:MAG: GCN5-related N-acetyltransferase [Flavipsychrobacter sp.]|nr:GCN5-related N-acetyltransferase [Flavipsychrobacter sp.]